jgi:hypothetical protein
MDYLSVLSVIKNISPGLYAVLMPNDGVINSCDAYISERILRLINPQQQQTDKKTKPDDNVSHGGKNRLYPKYV